MKGTARRAAKKEAIAQIMASGKGVRDALNDLFMCELMTAHEEMEQAKDSTEICQAQGRCHEIRNLLAMFREKAGNE